MSPNPVNDELDRLALGVLMASFAGTGLAADATRLLADGLGGLCLFGSNTGDGLDAVGALTAAARGVSPDVVVSIDEEGGDVTRLHHALGSPVLGALALGTVDDVELTRTTGAAVGTELSGRGIDLVLGPVADLNTDPDNPVIGTRSFGTDPHGVARHVAAWLEGAQSAGVAACAKHFPGHGDTASDSHLDLPRLDVPLDLLLVRELVPFVAAVRSGVAAVMTSHIVVGALDDSRPATLSPVVLGCLRRELGFEGVIVSDALDMAGVCAGRGIPEAAVLSLMAGADLLCLGPDQDAGQVHDVRAAIVAAVCSGRLPEIRLHESVARIAALPRGPGTAQPRDDEAQEAGARAAIRIEGEVPDLDGAVLVRVETEPNIAVGPVPWGLPADLATTADALAAHAGGRPVLVQARDAHRHPQTRALLAEIAPIAPVVLIEWGWPGPLDVPLVRVVAQGSSRPAVHAVAALLRERGWRP